MKLFKHFTVTFLFLLISNFGFAQNRESNESKISKEHIVNRNIDNNDSISLESKSKITYELSPSSAILIQPNNKKHQDSLVVNNKTPELKPISVYTSED